MLDAAHGEAVSSVVSVQRQIAARVVDQTGCVRAGGRERRRSPTIASRADGIQGSRRNVAVARSRRVKQSLK